MLNVLAQVSGEDQIAFGEAISAGFAYGLAAIGPGIGIHKRRHEFLPAGVHFFCSHFRLRSGKVHIRFKIAKDQTIFTIEQRVVMPARFAQRIQHFRPDVFMMFFVFCQPVCPDLELKPDTFHKMIPVFLHGASSRHTPLPRGGE